MKSKLIKFSLFLFIPLLVSLAYLFWPGSTKAESSDAIAIRIVDNAQHYSSMRWYQSQNFTGSPQSVQIDGYDAIRNNQTAYVNVANVTDENKDGVLDSLHTNIFIISFTQDTKGQTADIFGQLIKNLKFNTNLPETGFCNKTIETACLSNNDCPLTEYCNSQKAKVIRDVRRMADLEDIRFKLESYKQVNNSFPRLKSGTYLANKSLSVWPSWQQTLATDLGSNLPIDPINKIGSCPNIKPTDSFDSNTCWDQINKIFATDLAQSVLPSGSHIYLYYSNDQGSIAKYCAQMESNYDNIKGLNCFNDKQANSQPTINGVSLFGQPKKEFIGYASISDPDGNPLKLTVALENPVNSAWLARKWRWGSGQSNFQILATSEANQKKIYAPYAGDIADPAYYKIRLTVDDGQGAPNSTYSQVYPISLSPLPSFLDKVSKTSVIGINDSLATNGVDANGDELTTVYFQSALYNNTPLTQTELQSHGFTISGINLTEKFQMAQHTGVYTVNIYATNPNMTTSIANSFFTYTIVNNPPVFQSLLANFSNNTTKQCNPDESCQIAIDNDEKATVKISGLDPDSHKVSYSLVDDLGGILKINSSSGLISGLEKINWHELSDKTVDISVKMSDEYCNNSSAEECSSIYTFSLLVKKYCSLDYAPSIMKAEIPQTITVYKTGDLLNTEISLSDCSVVGTTTADVKFVGESHSQAIVLVSDVSKSMDTNVDNKPAIDRLKNALVANGTGFFDRIYNIVQTWPTEFFVKIGLVAYNRVVVDSKNLVNIINPGSLTSLKGSVSLYATDYETNTLLALNEAEKLLASTTNPNIEKIVILMSDGIPGVDGYTTSNPYCYTPSPPSCQCGTYPKCTILKCDGAYKYQVGCECYTPTCGSYEGEYPHCNYPPYIPPRSGYNNLLDVRRFISRLISVKPAQAITTQTKCVFKNCEQAFPNFSCSNGDIFNCWIQNDIPCDLTTDVDIQAQAMKDAGISLYTIYYNTSGTLEPEQKMCNWSSNNGALCKNNTFAYAGTDIDSMINNVLRRIVTKPKDVTVNSYPIIDEQPTLITSQNMANIKGLTCGNIRPVVTFSNNGYLEFTNMKIDYCPIKLHP